MPGNSRRQGAVRKSAKGNPTAGSGGRRRRALEGKGPTPKAKDRVGHVASRRTGSRDQRAASPRRPSPSRPGASAGSPEWVAGRNAVVEALRAEVPASALYVTDQPGRDERVREALGLAAERGLPVLEVPRPHLDRLTGDAVHQGVALQVPAYDYAHPDDLVDRARDMAETPLLVALDGVTDPRNLGAVVRSAAAFGAHGVVVPERRAAGMTASAWKASAGAATRVPVAAATNLTRQLKAYQQTGLMVAGLDTAGETDLADMALAADPLVLVVGGEGAGLSRLVREACDMLVRIPVSARTESLNAGVAAGIALYEIARRRCPGG